MTTLYENTARVFETGCMIRLFHNPSLQKKYLRNLIPQLWQNHERRLIVYTMQILFKRDLDINIENMVMAQFYPEIIRFRKKHLLPKLETERLYDLLFDPEVNVTPDIFPEAYEELHRIAFCNAADAINKDITYEVAYRDPISILTKAKAIQKIYQIIYGNRYKIDKDVIQETAKFINERDEYIRLSFSPKLGGLLGGWTRGWAGVLLGKSQNAKSTLMTYDTVLKAINGSVGDITVISTEEPELLFFRRVLAMILKIPIEDMRNRVVRITKEHVEKVNKLLQNRIKFYHVTDFKDVIDVLYAQKSKYGWIDHINSIMYPKNDMINGVRLLLHKEIEYFKQHPYNVMINLSQVNEKLLDSKPGIWKHPTHEDAYGNQSLYHHCREYLTIYYPYKDTIQKPKLWSGKKELSKATKDAIYLRVEKSSLGDLAEVRLKFNYEVGTFEDSVEKISNIETPDFFNQIKL